jgi:hypothetical protein
MADFETDAIEEEKLLALVCGKNELCAVGLDVVLLLLVFTALAIVCDDYLVPSIEVMYVNMLGSGNCVIHCGRSYANGGQYREMLPVRAFWHLAGAG